MFFFNAIEICELKRKIHVPFCNKCTEKKLSSTSPNNTRYVRDAVALAVDVCARKHIVVSFLFYYDLIVVDCISCKCNT